jgi:hypothetical protein
MVPRWLTSSLSAVLAPRRKTRPAAHRPRVEGLEDRTALSNVHLVGDLSVEFRPRTDTLTVSGKLAGLGNKDFDIAVSVTGEVHFDVRNPAGQEAPGITKKVNGFTDVTVDQSAIQNGTYTFTVSVPLNVGPLGLPNSQWTATFEGGTFDVSVVVTQGKETTNLGTFQVTV